MRRVVEMTVADLDARSGLLGQWLGLALGDDACNPRRAVSVTNHAFVRGAARGAGHDCSATSVATSGVYAGAGLLRTFLGSTNPCVTGQGLRDVFRVCGRHDQQPAMAPEYVARRFPERVVAIANRLELPA